MPVTTTTESGAEAAAAARQLASGICFAIVLGVAAMHLLLRWDVVLLPPYWDSIQGPFVEALWLRNNGFDYWQLFRHEPGLDQGGAAIYVWSLVPTVFAVAYALLPSPPMVFAALHILTFLLVGGIALVVYQMAFCELRMSRGLAVLTTAAVVLQPTFAGQTDAMNMEIPTALGCLLVARAFIRGQKWRCCALSCLALCLKDAAYIICTVNFCWVLLACLLAVGERRSRWLWLLATSVPMAMRNLLSWYVWSQPNRDSQVVLGFTGSRELLRIWQAYPELYLAAAVATLLAMVRLLGGRQPSVVGALRSALAPRPNPALYLLGVWTAFAVAGFFVASPVWLNRYAVWYLALATLGTVHLAATMCPATRRLQWGLVAYVMFGLANHYGSLRPALLGLAARSGDKLERSREYLADLRSNLRVARFLDEKAGARPIVVSLPLDRAYAVPALGYVSRPLAVFSENVTGVTYAELGAYADLNEAGRRAAWYVYRPSTFTRVIGTQEVPGTLAEVLFADEANGVASYVYRLTTPSAPQLPTAPAE